LQFKGVQSLYLAGRHCPQSVYERLVPHWPITFNDAV
jgi:hypothetical protein